MISNSTIILYTFASGEVTSVQGVENIEFYDTTYADIIRERKVLVE